MTNYAKSYASTTYQSLISPERLTKKCLCNGARNNALRKKLLLHTSFGMNQRFMVKSGAWNQEKISSAVQDSSL